MAEAKWTKTAYLKKGMWVATQDGWENITAVYKTGVVEQVYDIEIAGTHNFVGNGIVAHNTTISNPGTAGRANQHLDFLGRLTRLFTDQQDINEIDRAITQLDAHFTTLPATRMSPDVQQMSLSMIMNLGVLARRFPAVLRGRYLQVMNTHADVLYKSHELAIDEFLTREETDIEHLHMAVIGTSESEISEQRQKNWQNVAAYITSLKEGTRRPLTLTMLGDLHRIANENILPRCFLGGGTMQNLISLGIHCWMQ